MNESPPTESRLLVEPPPFAVLAALVDVEDSDIDEMTDAPPDPTIREARRLLKSEAMVLPANGDVSVEDKSISVIVELKLLGKENRCVFVEVLKASVPVAIIALERVSAEIMPPAGRVAATISVPVVVPELVSVLELDSVEVVLVEAVEPVTDSDEPTDCVPVPDVEDIPLPLVSVVLLLKLECVVRPSPIARIVKYGE